MTIGILTIFPVMFAGDFLRLHERPNAADEKAAGGGPYVDGMIDFKRI